MWKSSSERYGRVAIMIHWVGAVMCGRIWIPSVLAFVDGSVFARGFLTDGDRCRLRSFVRPVGAVHVTAGPDEVREFRVPGPNQGNEL